MFCYFPKTALSCFPPYLGGKMGRFCPSLLSEFEGCNCFYQKKKTWCQQSVKSEHGCLWSLQWWGLPRWNVQAGIKLVGTVLKETVVWQQNSCLCAPDRFSKLGCGEKQFQQKELFLFAGSIALCGFWNWRKRGNLKGEIVFPKHWFQFSLQNFPYWIQNMVADSSVSGV